MSASAISLERVTKVYEGGVVAVDDVTLEVAAGRVRGARRPVGVRQVDAAADDRRSREGDRGDGPDRRARRHDRRRRRIATSRWCSRTTRCTRTSRCARTSRSGCASGGRRARRSSRRVARDGVAARPRGADGRGARRSCRAGSASAWRWGARWCASRAAFLLDEPLSNLDAKLRTTMRAELARLHERLGVTTVYVTHDQIEAMTLGQRVAVLRDGVLQQFDVPQELFRRPVNLFVAAFIGSPPMNLVGARRRRRRVAFAGRTRCPLRRRACRPATWSSVCGRARSSSTGRGPIPSCRGSRSSAELVEELGDEAVVTFRVDAPPVEADAVKAAVERRRRGAPARRRPRRALLGAPAGACRRAVRRAADARGRPPRAAPVRSGLRRGATGGSRARLGLARRRARRRADLRPAPRRSRQPRRWRARARRASRRRRRAR